MTGCPPEGTLTQAEIRALLDNGPIGERQNIPRGCAPPPGDPRAVLRRIGGPLVHSSTLAVDTAPATATIHPYGRVMSAQPGFPPCPGKPARMLRPQAPGQGHQSQPPRPRQRFEETAMFRDRDNGFHPKVSRQPRKEVA